MPRGSEKRGEERVVSGAHALIIVRTPATHNSRELREAHILRDLGYRPRILGVVSEQVRERQATVQGIPVTRLSPTSPFSWLRMLLRRSRDASTAGPGTTGWASRDAGAGVAMSLAIRVHRWFRTIDFYRRAVAAVRDIRPALIHCNDYNTMWVGVAARLMGGTAVVYDSHELWPDRNLRPEPRWWLLACEFLFVRCAHRTITASPGYAEVMARRYRIPPPQVIRNIPADVPVDGSVADDVTAPVADGAPVAVYVGALTSGRGLEVSIRALARVPGVRLRLVGPSHDHYRAELGELARREGVADRFEMATALPPERLVNAIREASVGLVLIQPVCLSYRMSLPNKLFEYVAAGVPVLGSDLPAIGALIDEHQIGLVAQPDQVRDVAAKLSAMLEPKRNDEFRRAVRAAAERLRWESESQLLADTYVQAVARPHSRSHMRASPPHIKPRLARTLSGARWDEYRRFLQTARERGYRVVALEEWVRESPQEGANPILIMRHDVDQHPRSALAMAAIEEDLGVRSSWYFRWRTAHPLVIEAIKRRGFDVGLHYETLTRKALERRAFEGVDDSLLAESRGDLRAEIAAFTRLFGPIRSVVPHGDSRIPAVHNGELLQDPREWEGYGIEFDGNEAMNGRNLGYWLTDRSSVEGGWREGIDPVELFASRISPILCLTHPNNWVSGPSLWLDRMLSALLPPVLPGSNRSRNRPIRTGSDQPTL